MSASPRISELAAYIYHYIQDDTRDPKPAFVLAEGREKELLKASHTAYEHFRMRSMSLGVAITAAVEELESTIQAEEHWVLATVVDGLVGRVGDEDDDDDDDNNNNDEEGEGEVAEEEGREEDDREENDAEEDDAEEDDAEEEQDGEEDYTWPTLLRDAFEILYRNV